MAELIAGLIVMAVFVVAALVEARRIADWDAQRIVRRETALLRGRR